MSSITADSPLVITSVNHLDGSSLDALNSGIQSALSTLQNWASTNPVDDVLSVFSRPENLSLDLSIWETLQTAWSQGDFSQLPILEIRSSAELQQANGAFAHSLQTIYLSDQFIQNSHSNPGAIAHLLLEEIGHFVDSQIRTSDTLGDEGALFASRVQGLSLNANAIQAIQTENDIATLMLNGLGAVEVEQMEAYGDSLENFQSGLENFLEGLEDTINSVLSAQNLPLIGNAVGTQAETLLAELRNAITTAFEELEGALTPASLQTVLNNALNSLSLPNVTLHETAEDVHFSLPLSQTVQLVGTDLDQSFGDLGFNLDIEGNAEVTAAFNWDLFVGMNADGFYVDTDAPNELGISLAAAIPGLEVDGTLGFLNASVTDNGSSLSGELLLDLQDDFSLDATLNAEATLDLNLEAGIDPGTGSELLPRIGTNLAVDWQFNAELSEISTAIPSVAFNGLYLDSGSLFSFLDPIFQGINTILEPLDPFINVLGYEFPIIDKTTIELIPILVEAFGGEYNEESQEFVEALTTAADILSVISSAATDTGTIDLGSFSYDTTNAAISPSDPPIELVEEFAQFGLDIGESAALKFPLLNDPTNVLRILLGQFDPDSAPVDIVQFEVPTLGFEVSATQTFPIPAFPPLKLTLTETFGAAATTGLGFDTQGLNDFVADLMDEDGVADPSLLANGFYIYTPPASNPPDPISSDEEFLVGLGVGVDAGARLTVGPVFIEPRIGIAPQLFFSLDGEGPDNKVRIDDFVNPSPCLFEARGQFDVRFSLLAGFGYGPFTIERKIVETSTTVADFRSNQDCSGSTVDHNQATIGPENEAILSVGEAANQLSLVNGVEANETFVIRHLDTDNPDNVSGNETITVDAYGASWTYENITAVEADPGEGDDVIDARTVLSPVSVTGGTGFDEIYGGEGNDTLNGGSDSDVLDGGGGNDILNGDEGSNFLIGGAGNDTLNGGGDRDTATYADAPSGVVFELIEGEVVVTDDGYGDQDTLSSIEQFVGSEFADVITGDSSNNIIAGEGGNDTLLGGEGDDFLIGNGGQDSMDGGEGFDGISYLESLAEVNIDLETGDVFSGGGSDADGDQLVNIEGVQGTQLTDQLRGDAFDNLLDGADGHDVLEGRAGADTLMGGFGRDTAEYSASPEGVTVNLETGVGQYGHAEGDVLELLLNSEGLPTNRNTIENLSGSSHDDDLTGDLGSNVLKGLDGEDHLVGGEGNDTLVGGVGADVQDGGGGLDWVDYSDSDAAVMVSLDLNNGSGGHAQGDTFNAVENLKGTPFADALQGNDRNNDIDPGLNSHGLGIDVVDGGDEENSEGDRLILNYLSSNTSLNGGYDHAAGSPDTGIFAGNVQFTEIERIQVIGSYLNDSILGGPGDDHLVPAGGDDTVFGGLGRNYIYGDDGDDHITNLNNTFGQVFYTPSASDQPIFWIDGGAGIDTFSGNLASRPGDIVLTGLNPDEENEETQLRLDDGSYLMRFERFQDIQTGSGDDQLTQLGRVDNDFRTGAGHDVVNTGLGIDFADGGASSGSLSPTLPDTETDLLIVNYQDGDSGGALLSEINTHNSGRYYRNTSDGTALLDEVQFFQFERVQVDGTPFNDTLIGLVNEDELQGHDGDDYIVGGEGNDHVLGNGGNDIVLGDNFVQVPTPGNQWNDTVSGGSGNDFLIGGIGNDSLSGEEGNDTLIGINYGAVPFPAQPEVDTMTGGAGADQFWLGDGVFVYYDDGNPFSSGAQEQAIITDFNPSQGDKIQLHGSAHDYTLTAQKGSTLIYHQGELIGTIQGVTRLKLTDSAFQYVDDSGVVEGESLAPILQVPQVLTAQLADPYSPEFLQWTSWVASPSAEEVESGSGSALGSTQPSELFAKSLSSSAAAVSPEVLNVESQAEIVGESSPFGITQQSNPLVLADLFTGDTTGITVLTVAVTGDGRGIGTFQYDPFGLGNGIVLSTGKVVDLVGENRVDGGFIGEANIPLVFTKLDAGAGDDIGGELVDAEKPDADPDDTLTDGEAPDLEAMGIFRAELTDPSIIRALRIGDSGSSTGGAGGDRSGFDLVGLKISNQRITRVDELDALPTLDVFDFSPLGTFLTPGTQRAGGNLSPDLFGTLHGQIDNTVATLDDFDFELEGNHGFVSLGDGGEIGFNLTEALPSDGPLYLYVAEAANNGETLQEQITVSSRAINGQSELSTDFGLPGVQDDTTRLSMSFEAQAGVEWVYFWFVAPVSEEFREFGGSDFNDVFTARLNGLNLARLSDGSAANINNLVPNSFGDFHPDFIHNPVETGPASHVSTADGFTKPLLFAGKVIPNAINELEIEVADVGDGWMDTAVFLQAGSFGVSEIPQGGLIITGPPDVLEGTTSAFDLSLTLVPTAPVTISLDPDQQLDLGSGAGVPIKVTIAPEDALFPRSIKFNAVDDGVVEGLHSGLITATVSSADPSYNTLDPLLVEQLIIDNDTAGTPRTNTVFEARMDSSAKSQSVSQSVSQSGALFIGGGDGVISLTPIKGTVLCCSESVGQGLGTTGRDEWFGLFDSALGNVLEVGAEGRVRRVYGGDGADQLVASPGDRLVGGLGNDELFASGYGASLLTGGVGADTFWIANGILPEVANSITDFEAGVDSIGLSLPGIGSREQLDFLQDGDDGLIWVGEQVVGRVLNTAVAALQDTTNFVFA